MSESILIIGNSTSNLQKSSNDDIEVEVGKTIVNIILIILIIFMILFIYNLVRCYLPSLINRNKRKMEEEEENNNNEYQKGNTYTKTNNNTVNLEDI